MSSALGMGTVASHGEAARGAVGRRRVAPQVLVDAGLARIVLARHHHAGLQDEVLHRHVVGGERNERAVLDGRLVGAEDRRSIRITVSANERRLEVLSGYNGEVINSQSFPNTQTAYKAFLSGLGGQGFMTAKKTDIVDPQSVCTNGLHHYYTLTEGSEKKSDLWSVSCDKSGTFNGRSTKTIRELFQRQIPEYGQQIQGVKL